MVFAKENLPVYLRKHWADAGEKLEDRGRLGVAISELIEHSKARNDAIDAPFLDLWVAILDELNSWLISLLGTVYVPARCDDTKLTDFESSIVTILIKLISDTTSMRHLITIGYDTSARTLLRSIAEYMQVLVAILDDPKLSAEFVTADTPEASNAFYFGHLAKGKLAKRTKLAWQNFFRDESDAAQFFSEHQRELGQLLSGTSHPSFAGGQLAAMHFIQDDPNENWLGHWGAKSNMSVLTISIYTKCFMALLLLASDYPFEGYDRWMSQPIAFDPSNEMHRHVKTGRSVLGSLILSLSKESNLPHIFPEGLEPNVEDLRSGS